MAERKWTIRVDEELAHEVELLAEATGTSVNRLVVDVLRGYVKRAENSPKVRAQVQARINELAERYGLDSTGERGDRL